MKKILIIGGGGREHALAFKAAQNPQVLQVFVAPGNAGSSLEDKVCNVDIAADDIPALLAFATAEAVDLTIVGPEQPLVLGVVDAFEAHGLNIFGANQKAAQLEGSKAFSKAFLARHHIPTAAYEVFEEVEAACAYIDQMGAPIVVKADGLAAGKGVVVAKSTQDAKAAVEDMLAGNVYGEAGSRVVIEQFLQGEEASFMVMLDGAHILPLATSQDHKARDDGDQGPNTGGMGAYSPAPCVDAAMSARIMAEIIEPTVAGLQKDQIFYRGFLYAGIMIDQNGNPQVLEFNCRMGDPETQPIMMRLKSDLVEVCERALAGELNQVQLEWDSQVAVGVVLAAGGYPFEYQKGLPISGLDAAAAVPNCKTFHAGSRIFDGQILTNGGRVLCQVALAENIKAAQQLAYQACAHISWQDMFYRHDIAHKAINR